MFVGLIKKPQFCVIFRMKQNIFLILLTFSCITWGWSQEASLAYNMNTKPSPASSGPTNFTVYNGKLYFIAFDPVHGRELRVHDGTGTKLVKDIYEGYKDADISELTVCNGKLYFVANDKEHGKELWVHNGTETKLAFDFYEGRQSSNPVTLVAVGNKLIFSARDGKPGEKVWIYDGVTPPEFLVDLWPDREADYFEELYYTRFDVSSLNYNLLLVLPTKKYGSELVTYNIHTKEYSYHDIRKGEEGSSPSILRRLNNKVYFAADDGIHGRILWYYDGKEVKMTNDLFPGSDERINDMKIIGDNLFIRVSKDKKEYIFKLNNETNIAEQIKDLYGTDIYFSDAATYWKNNFYFLKEGNNREYIMFKTDGKSTPVPVCYKDTMALNIAAYPTAIEYNQKLYFSANDKKTGFELWAIDNDKPKLMADINTADEPTLVYNMFKINSELFIRSSQDNTIVLYKYNGKNAPQIVVNKSNGKPITNPYSFVLQNEKMFFLNSVEETKNIWVYEPGKGARELNEWTSGHKTTPIYEIYSKNDLFLVETSDTINEEPFWRYWKLNPSGNFSEIILPIRENWDYNLKNTTKWNNKYYFFHSTTEKEKPSLWVYDGEKENKQLATITNSIIPIKQKPVLFKNTLVFTAIDSLNNCLLCTYDSIGGIKKQAIPSKTKGAIIEALTVFNNELYFYTCTSPYAKSNAHNTILWKCDGKNPPFILKEIKDKQNSIGHLGIAVFNNELFFGAYLSDYTKQAFKYNINGEIEKLEFPDFNFENAFILKNKLFFIGSNKNNWSILWQYNGKDKPIPFSKMFKESSVLTIEKFQVFKDKLIFSSYNRNGISNNSLWEFDGESPPVQLTKKYPGFNATKIDFLDTLNNKLYFVVNKEFSDYELWQYDGKTTPRLITSLIGEINEPILDIASVANKLFISTKSGWWYYDGKSSVNKAETYLDLSMDFIKSISLPFNGKYYGAPFDSEYGKELIEFDSLNTPKLLMDINPGYGSGFVGPAVAIGDKICFLANDRKHDEEIWVYDGKKAPYLLKDIITGYDKYRYHIKKLTPLKNKLYFVAGNSQYGEEVWIWDGKTEPHVLADLNPGNGSSEPDELFVHNNKLYFTANDGTHGVELWEYNGMGTPKLLDINKIQYDSNPSSFFSYKNYLFFSADDGLHGEEPWMYDGINPPKMIKDIYKGKESSYPDNFSELSGILYFFADDGIHGQELWKFPIKQ